MSKFFQRSWFLVLGTWTRFSKAIPQDKNSINQSINPSRESIISTQKDALRFPLYQRHGISNIPPHFLPNHRTQECANKTSTTARPATSKAPSTKYPFPFLSSLFSPFLHPPPPAPVPCPAFLTAPSPATPQTKPHRNPASQHKNPRKTNQQHRAGKSSAETSRRS